MSDNNIPAKRNAVSPPSFGYAVHQRPPGWLKLADGSEWTASVAVVRGLIIKDGEKDGNIYVQDRSLPASMWIEQGVIDEECARQVLALPQAKNPQPPVEMVSRRVEKTWRPTLDPSSLELALVAALRDWIESDMGPESDEKLGLAFRRAVRAAAGMSSR
jgi:hypothetical protein